VGWRILRALIATGYATQGWTDVPPEGRTLFERLASVLPEFRLPPASLGHSRHYMPLGKLDKGREATALVFDAFAHLGSAELWIRWPVTPGTEEQQLFSDLASHLGYLGRSESWVFGEALSDDVALPSGGRAFPHSDGDAPLRTHEQIALIAPEPADRYASFRAREVEAARAALENEGKKPTKTALDKHAREIAAAYPVDLLDALQWDTAQWKEAKWSQAPGSRRVLYWRPSGALEVTTAVRRRPHGTPATTMVLYALTTPSGSRSALPTLARTVPQADLLHRALVKRSGRTAPELSGRADDGAPLTKHDHSHVLPLDLDEDRHLDHILLYVPRKLSRVGLSAALSVERTYTKGGVGELDLAIAGRGALRDLLALPDPWRRSVKGLLGPARAWMSATPFVPPRFLKKRGKNTLEGQVLAELSARGFPTARVERIPWSAENGHLRHVIRHRSKERGAPQPPMDVGFLLRLHFEEPVPGPICIGYGAHFGLGRFDSTKANS
jgi:CRISPR-associated protein Csb2